MSRRQVLDVITAHRQHEGAGFIVRRPFPSSGLRQADPFLMLDEMGPVEYRPGEAVGAPDHPHRGFETVSYILEGEVEHEDSAGHRGKLGAGDVQWMTAGRGIIHSEEPSRALLERGGRVHAFQVWVNLPARDKMMSPRYQEIPRVAVPEAQTPDGLAKVKVVAGEALGVRAIIETRTPISYHHWTLSAGADANIPLPPAYAAYLYVFEGKLRVDGREIFDGQLAVLGDGDAVQLDAEENAQALLLAGVPLRESVAQYGPFVMNTPQEIEQAIEDYRTGHFAKIVR
jgi:redox-sensitive bicupin YhaK (pirin superfamily)